MRESRMSDTDSNEVRLQKAAASLGKELLNKEQTSKEATRLLLEGWKMLGETCPISEFPLFQNKKTNEIWSVRLQMPVRREPQPDSSASSTVEAGKQEATNSTRPDSPRQEPSKKLQIEQDDELDGMINEMDLPLGVQQSTNDVSKIIGNKLLLGWEMLNETVNGCPVMRDPANGKKWLPLTGTYLEENLEPEAKQCLPAVARDVVIKSSSPVATRKEDDAADDEKTSERLSQKMLLGWQMLYEHCPVTKTCPLLLDTRTGKKWSAALNQYVEHSAEEEMEARTAGENNKTVSSALPSSTNALRSSIQQNPKATTTSPTSSFGNVSASVTGILEEKIGEWSRMLRGEASLETCKLLLELIRDASLTRRELSKQ